MSTFNPSEIMTRAWQLARIWFRDARSFHYAQQQGDWRVASRKIEPAPFVGKQMDHFRDALVRAWAEARQAQIVASPEIIVAKADLACAEAIESWPMAQPAIRAARVRLAELTLS